MNAAAVRKAFEEGVARIEQALAAGRRIAWLSLAASVVALTAAICAIFVHVIHACRDWCLREISPLANHSGDGRRTGSGNAFCMGLRALLEAWSASVTWAFVAPILISLGIPDIDAIRVAAIANNAPVSYGALGAPIIGLAAVTGLPLLQLSASVGHVVAVLALLPPWVLIYLVSGKNGFREGWPLAIVGSIGYLAGQFPVAVYLGPYLPDAFKTHVTFSNTL